MSEIIEQPMTKSSRKRRIAAFLIDQFVFTFVMVAAVFLAIGPHFLDGDNSDKIFAIMLWLMIPGFFLYFAKDSIKGISIGRWITGIMVRDEADLNTTPSFWKLFIRNIFVTIWPVEFIALAISEEKKRLGDQVTKTVVLQNPNKAKLLPRTLSVVGLGMVYFAFIFLFTGSSIKNSAAYHIAIQNIETNQKIINETGGITGYGTMPTGSVSITGDQGQAQLQIKVLGKTKDVKVNVYLEKMPNEPWKLIKLEE